MAVRSGVYGGVSPALSQKPTQEGDRNMKSIKNILWPTDASESALRALDAAVVMAEKFEATIHVLQVVEQIARPAHTGFTGDPLTAFNFPLYEEQLVESARKNLNATVAGNVPASVNTAVNVEIGLPRETIVAFCVHAEIDLIVMATHGREGLSHLWLGSVAEATVRRSPVPVLVIPPDGKRDGEDG